jgi:hypothetical protein
MGFTPTTPQFQRGYSFLSKEQNITNVKLHNLLDLGYLLPASITGWQTLTTTLTGNEQILIVSSGTLYNITTQTLANLAAATGVANGSLTDAKMARNTLIGGAGGSIGLDTVIGATTAGAGNVAGGSIHGYNVANDLTHNNFAANEIMVGVGPLDVYNPIINGGFGIDQRNVGASVTITTTSKYICDKWKGQPSPTLTASLSCKQQTVTTPAGVSNTLQQPIGALQVTVGTAQASLAAGDYFIVSQYIEGYYAQPLAGQTFSLSFWMLAPVTGTMCVSFRNSGSDRSYVAEVPITTSGSFQRYTITNIPVMPTGGGTWNFTTGAGLQVSFCFGSGSTFQTSPNAWQTGSFIADSNQTNFLSALQTFYISAVKLEPNPVCTPYVYKGWNQELADCQRYFYKSWALATAVGTAASVQSLIFTTISASLALGTFRYPVKMRVGGSPVLYNYNTGGTATVYDATSGTNIGSSPAAAQNGEDGISVISFTSGGTSGHLIQVQVVNDVDL